ncbi:MAG TPA: phosphatidylglycerophosphatase A [Candidatus Acidoferrales bacterium]|nr:phosphatidylglycerophosphatase A [Candidatus Acidoferrales bacterium]
MSDPAPNLPTTTTSSEKRKPFVSLAMATAFGLGYLPKAPGTWGSLAGVVLGWAALAITPLQLAPRIGATGELSNPPASWWLQFAWNEVELIFIISVIGVWAAGRTARYLQNHDPQIVVIDEVAGQLISYLGLATPKTFALNWKYLLLGFILFRVFDIWKPFPARQAESLPGGLGIMADDWIAGIYAALGLWIARAAGL